MERCDFSSVITTIRKYLSDGYSLSQADFLYELFASFMNDDNSRDFDFDNGQVCRWMNGQAKISPRISGFYREKLNQKLMAVDIEEKVLPLMYDSAMAVQEVYGVLVRDSEISEPKKKELTRCYPCKSGQGQAAFLASVLCFCMERPFIKRDAKTQKLLPAGSLSPVLKDYVFDGGVPKPCKYFCGRDQELSTLHELLCENSKVFLRGIAGIGKSELVKAYAKQYRKEFTNILYLIYSGDLKQDIADMDFADDLSDDSNEERFLRHNRFLRTLKEDTLLIIDNFNATATQDSLLPVVLKYHCRVLFTTRSRFDNYNSMNLEEISDKGTLLNLVGCFYSDAQKYPEIVEQIIETVHSHTLAVELAARLLETGILEPAFLLKKLQEEKAAFDAADTIGIIKDGQSQKATYYTHIHTLFALYQLSGEELNLMRSLALIPAAGISARLFANWLKLCDMNTINDLVEKGFVQTTVGRTISLHLMVQEVAVEETKPSIQNCRTLLTSLQDTCLRHGEDIPYYKKLFQTIENIVELIDRDDTAFYLRFLEDAFPYMEKYHYEPGMKLILNELITLLQNSSVGSESDRALLLDYRAACETKLEKSIALERKAIATLTEITQDSAHLASNLYASLGILYKRAGNLELAEQNMKQGICLLEQFGLLPYHDSIPQVTSYAVLLTDMGKPGKGLAILEKLAQAVCEYNTDQSSDYAAIQEAMGNICLTTGNIQQATAHFKKAMAVYELLFEANPDVLEAKRRELFETYEVYPKSRTILNFRGQKIPRIW